MSRPAVDALRGVRERNRFMKGIFAWVGFRQTQLPYRRDARHAGETKWNWWSLLRLAIEGITSFSSAPLQLATWMGLAVSALAFAYALHRVVITLLRGPDVPGYPSLLVVILFLGGVQLITLGIIGEYIGRIYQEVKQRPLYLVRRRYGQVAEPPFVQTPPLRMYGAGGAAAAASHHYSPPPSARAAAPGAHTSARRPATASRPCTRAIASDQAPGTTPRASSSPATWPNCTATWTATATTSRRAAH